MTAFDANDPIHNTGIPLDVPGRHVVEATQAMRIDVKSGEKAAVVRVQVLLGEHKGRTVSRVFMLTGKGTRWFASLLKAVKCPKLTDINDDAEVSKAISKAPFSVLCAKGRIITDDNNEPRLDENNEPLRYLEIREVYPITQEEREALVADGYKPNPTGDLFVEQDANPAGWGDTDMGDDGIPF